MDVNGLKNFVSVKVPATTANLGPGFDCLGIALDLWNTVEFRVGQSGIVISGEGANYLENGPKNLVHQSAAFLFNQAGISTPTMEISCQNNIPVSRGLGSSSAAVVSGLIAANAMCGSLYSSEELLKFAIRLEGHPDNVVPAILGGCKIVVTDGEELIVSSVPIPESIRAVLFIPEEMASTERSRELLSPQVTRSDAIFNISRAALLVNALNTGTLPHLRVGTQDRLHQPQREAIFPGMQLIIRAGLDAGALGAFLSGSGSTIVAIVRDHAMTVSYEMADIAAKKGIAGQLKVVEFSQTGSQVTALE